MKSLKIISLLLNYPSEEVAEAASELPAAIDACNELKPEDKLKLRQFADTVYAGDLMDSQEKYVGIFDRGRATSLLLFEHVHGESRDRGQAMVDLMELYDKAGFEINVRELPDFIPLYLEYLSYQDRDVVVEGLADISHILAMISARLFDRDSVYHVLFDVLLELAHVEIDVDALRKTAAAEERDDSLEALDKIWEEEAVRFDGSDVASCTASKNGNGLGQGESAPVHFIKIRESGRTKSQQPQ